MKNIISTLNACKGMTLFSPSYIWSLTQQFELNHWKYEEKVLFTRIEN